jgi:hypothetical protein
MDGNQPFSNFSVKTFSVFYEIKQSRIEFDLAVSFHRIQRLEALEPVAHAGRDAH